MSRPGARQTGGEGEKFLACQKSDPPGTSIIKIGVYIVFIDNLYKRIYHIDMSKTERKSVPKLITLFPQQILIINRFIEEKGFASASEVIRQALMFYHDKYGFRPYLEPTPGEEEKRKKLDKEKKLDAVPDDVFALQTLHAKIVNNEKGVPYALMHRLGNLVLAVPLSDVKDWAKDNQSDINYHLSKLSEGRTVESLFTHLNKDSLYVKHQIVV